jgi:hypothetical protein
MFQMDITSGFIRWSVKVRYDVPTPKIHPKIKVSVGSNNFPKIIFRIILTWQPVFMISQVWARLEYHLHIRSLGKFVIFLAYLQFWQDTDYLNQFDELKLSSKFLFMVL